MMPVLLRLFSPLDEELALLPGAFAPRLVADAVRLGTWIPFDRIPDLLRGFVGTLVSAPTVRRLTEGAGAAYVAVQTSEVARLEQTLAPPPAGPAVLQASVDGAMVPLRGKGEWTEVKTLAIGRVDAGAATVTGAAPGEPLTVDLSSCSRRAAHATFTRLATVETHRRGVETAGTVCGVVDGADWCQQFFDVQRPDAVRILDFSPAAGYLAQIAQAAFGAGTAETATWLEAQRHALKHEPPEGVLATIRAVHARVVARPDGAAAAETIAKGLASLEKRQDHLRYATFAAQGYPIGRGMVESANKLVVEARLKGAGRHWAPEHVDPMVALRTIVCADRWDEAWPLICGQLRQDHRATAAQRRAQRRATRQDQQTAPEATPEATSEAPSSPPPCAAPAPRAQPPHDRTSEGGVSCPPGAAPPRSRRRAPDHPWRRRFIVPSTHARAAAQSGAKL